MTRTLVECLKLFNRKERYWLIRNALGEPGEELPLSNSFRKRLGEATNTDIPADAWWALDYHIDWLFGALVLDGAPEIDKNTILSNPSANTTPARRLIRGTQEDFDFIIAFDRTILLIEAKATGSWTNRQMTSKHQRMSDWDNLSSQIQTAHKDRAEPPRIMVVFMSPNKSDGLKQPPWPKFVNDGGNKPGFLTMDFSAAPEEFRVPERFNNAGRAARDSDLWRLKSVKRPKPRIRLQSASVVAMAASAETDQRQAQLVP